jgi:hypothetical protein
VTATTTAVLMISAKGFGPFSSPGWRLNASVQVVDGSNSGPYLLTSQTEPETQKAVEPLFVDSTAPEIMVDAIVLLLAAQVGSDNALGWLLETENLIETEPSIRFASYWDLDERVRETLLQDFRDRIKIGIVVLDKSSSVNGQVLSELSALGVEVVEFENVEATTSCV